jgi:hypothetical protein
MTALFWHVGLRRIWQRPIRNRQVVSPGLGGKLQRRLQANHFRDRRLVTGGKIYRFIQESF